MASATTLQAATQAVQRDAAGDAPSAIVFYEQAAEGLVADCAAIGAGPEVDAMRAKRDEYLARARVLRAQSAMPDAAGGGPTVAAQQGQAPAAAEEKKGWQMYAGAAGAGALGGAMVIGSVIGAPIMGAMAGAGALAYATTREDGVGEAARNVGTGTSNAVTKAREVNADYKLTEKAANAAKATTEAAQAVDGKYHVTEKVSGLFSGLGKKASSLDTKYNISGKAGGAVGAALDGVAGAAGTVTAGAVGAGSHPAGSGAAPGKQPGGATGPTAI